MGGGWMMAGYGLIAALLLAAVVALIIVVVTRGRNRVDKDATTPTAAEILAQRYARGEIDDDEYLQRRSVLDASHLPLHATKQPH
jgi:putative membrane protein